MAQKGIAELEEVFGYLADSDVQCGVELDLTLARGLNYYTGAILEVKALGVEMGSISGGGRYDNLTGIFGLPGVSGVGFSFGADRIYDVLTMLDKFPKNASQGTKILLTYFDKEGQDFCRNKVRILRRAGIPAEIYPEITKFKKQMSYANACNIPFVAIAGETEMAANALMLKDMETGEQQLLSVEQIIDKIK